MKWLVVVLAILVLIGGYSYVTTINSPLEPLGRLALVKFANPDMFPGHLHSKLLAQYAKEKGSKSALVVHFAGSSNYRHYMEGDVLIIELGFIDTQGTGAEGPLNYTDSVKLAIFGIPGGRYKYKADGKVFNTYDEAMAYVYGLARENGQEGPIPMVWHGNARSGSPILNPGCGYPLYFDILRREYGVIPAYIYTLYGLIFPYFNDPYWEYELQNAPKLQNYYQEGELNYK